METLKDFASKDFTEQIILLEEIGGNNRQDLLPDLFEIYKEIPHDDGTKNMVKNTLQTLLSKNEEETVKGMASDNIRQKLICIKTSGQEQFKSAVSALVDLSKAEEDSIILFEAIAALSKINAPEALEIFRKNIFNPEQMIVAQCLEMIGKYVDFDSIGSICEIIKEAESDVNFEECGITTVKAIEALGVLKNDEALSFLVSKIHHRNPTARRFIQEEIIKAGSDAIPLIAPIFNEDNMDKKTQAAIVLGYIGSKECGEILVNAVDKGAADNPNTKFAVYDALGKVTFLKGLICLMDGLLEKDDYILMAVVSSLNAQVNPAVTKNIKDFIDLENGQSKKVIQAIVSSKAFSLFELLYEDENIGAGMMKIISASNDEEIITAFCEKLELIGTEKSKSDAEKLRKISVAEREIRLLAVDDSKSMLMFFRSIASELGFDIVTALNGEAALKILGEDDEFDVVVTDMNMPVMDGMELTRKIRDNPRFEKLPIVMVTTESASSQMQLAEKVGVNDFIKKPFSIDKFRDKIKDLI